MFTLQRIPGHTTLEMVQRYVNLASAHVRVMASSQRGGKAWENAEGDRMAVAATCDKAILRSHAVVFIRGSIGRVAEDVFADVPQ